MPMPNTETVSLESATQLLKQLLEARSPELGARLKQRLIASLREQGLPRFDERGLGYKNFHSFLERTQADWLDLVRPSVGSGDILVSLRDRTAAGGSLPARGAPLPKFRNEVWQAFTNPDAARRRYFHKKTGRVLHFKAGDGSHEEVTYSMAPKEFAEIEFIEGNQQLQWMEEFMNGVPVIGDERTAYESMMSSPYSSAMNAAFARSLGDKQDQWREFRTSRVATVISNWASKNDVPMQLLERGFDESTSTQRSTDKESHTVRDDALQLLNLLTEQEIKRVVIPVLLTTMLLRSRD